jgi:hypothetical protein
MRMENDGENKNLVTRLNSNHPQITTRSGRTVRPPARYAKVEGVVIQEIAEIMAVGAGIGGGFEHTSELVPMTFDQAMKKDPEGWDESVAEEHVRMEQHVVFQAVN